MQRDEVKFGLFVVIKQGIYVLCIIEIQNMSIYDWKVRDFGVQFALNEFLYRIGIIINTY